MMFIGANDTSTLEGAIEEIDRLIRREEGIERRATKVKTRERAVYCIAVLREMRLTFDMAKENGPTPDLTKLRARMATPDLERLLEDQAQTLSGRLGDIDYEIVEDDTDRRFPMCYAYAVGGVRSPKNYLDRVTALTAMVDRLGTLVTETEDAATPVS